MQEDKPEIISPSPPLQENYTKADDQQKYEKKSLQLFKEYLDQTKALKAVLKSEDIFNILRDMPHEQNIITGDGGWKNHVTLTGSTVFLFPALQMHQLGCNDDLNYITGLLSKLENASISSGYMGFPNELVTELSKIKHLKLLLASPQV